MNRTYLTKGSRGIVSTIIDIKYDVKEYDVLAKILGNDVANGKYASIGVTNKKITIDQDGNNQMHPTMFSFLQ
jgi:hypothetical protein